MGLRHRTAMSALREQRRCAEQKQIHQLTSGLAAYPRKVGRRRFEPLDAGESAQRPAWSMPAFAKVPDQSQKLLLRLRQSLRPGSDENVSTQAVQSAYLELQDELLRLSQHTAQKRQESSAQTESEINQVEMLRELLHPSSAPLETSEDELPFRSIVILPRDGKEPSPAPRAPIQALSQSLQDLSFYNKPKKEPTPLTRTNLTLVGSPESAALLLDHELNASEMSAEAAHHMQQSLQIALGRAAPVPIPNDIILSLLDT